MAVGKDGYVGLVRLRDGSLHLAAALRPGPCARPAGRASAASVLLAAAGFPAIDGLASARWQGTPDSTRRTRPLADARVFVLGDAAGYVEPFTGEGIAWALASGASDRNPGTPCRRAMGTASGIGEWEILHHVLSAVARPFAGPPRWCFAGPGWPAAACEVMSRLPGSTRRIVALLNAHPLRGSELTMPATIAGIGTALPTHRINQSDSAEIARAFSCETKEQDRVFSAIFRLSGVETSITA